MAKFTKYRITRKMSKVPNVTKPAYLDETKFRAWIFEGLSGKRWVQLSGAEYFEIKSSMLKKAMDYRVGGSKTFKPEVL